MQGGVRTRIIPSELGKGRKRVVNKVREYVGGGESRGGQYIVGGGRVRGGKGARKERRNEVEEKYRDDLDWKKEM